MKSFQECFYQLNKVHEFKIKIAGIEVDSTFKERLVSVLEAYCVETVTEPKRIPIQEHQDFPKMGPCECYMIDIGLKYPTIPDQLRQLIIERARVPANAVCVYYKDQYDLNEEFEAHGKDHDGALLTDPALADDSGQELAGQKRVDAIKSGHTSKKFDFVATLEKASKADSQDIGTKSPIGSK